MKLLVDKLFGCITLLFSRWKMVQFGLPRRWHLESPVLKYVSNRGWHWLYLGGILRLCWRW